MMCQLLKSGRVRNRASGILLCCIITVTNVSVAAEKLEITDEYLRGLSAEISSPEYVNQAKEELRQTEKHELTLNTLSPKISQALANISAFEHLLKTEYPASYKIYSELSTQSRNSVFMRFSESKKLSMAKRLIIDLYLNL